MSITFCIMQSCSTEEALMQNEAIIKTVSREQAIQFLQQNPLRTSIKKAIKTNNSPNYDAISQEEISNSDQFLTVIPLLNNDKTQHSRIVLLTINDTLKNAIFTMYPDGEQKTKDFSGRLMITNLSGEFKNGFRVKDGFLVSQFVLKINGAKSTGTNKSASDDLGTILNEVIIPPRKKATIQINYIFDSSSPVYDNSTPDSFTWDFEKYGGGGGTSAEAEAEPVVEVEDAIEDNIDDSKLDPCPKAVMDQLKNTTNNDVAAILNKLGANSVYTVNMVMKPAATYAETQPISKYNYEIRVDRNQYTNGTKLFKATALIHEVIHAYFLSIVDDYNYTPSTALPNFPELFEAYVLKTNPDSNNKEDAQHKVMADKYVAAMASALQEYDANYTIPHQVYEDLAWGGLSETPIFAKTYPPGSAESIRIKNRYAAEAVGFTVGSGTPQEQKPVGKPCN